MYRYICVACLLVIFIFFPNHKFRDKETEKPKDLQKTPLDSAPKTQPGFEPFDARYSKKRSQFAKSYPNVRETRLLKFMHPGIMGSPSNHSTLHQSSKAACSTLDRKSNFNRALGHRRLLGFVDQSGEKIDNISATDRSYKFPNDIQDLCPFADFCGLKAAYRVLKPGAVSCCKSCYCDEKCIMRGDCCFPEQGTYSNNSKNHVCTEAAALQRADLRRKMRIKEYPMIDRCLNNNFQTCRDKLHAPWGGLFPVYSSQSNTIYFNKYCAFCNDEQDFYQWKAFMRCYDWLSNEYEMHATSFNGTKCPIFFEPPDNAVDKIFECRQPEVTSCNVTGTWKVYDSNIENACQAFEAPVYDKTMKSYKNIYCLICNEQINGYGKLCNDGDVKGGGQSIFSFLLDWEILSQTETTALAPFRYTSGCPRNTVKHPYKDECRPLYCPFGFTMTSSGCQMFSKEWYKSGYLVMVELQAEKGGRLFPRTAFTDLSTKKLKNPGSWLNANGLLLQYFGLSILTDMQNNTSFVKKILIRLGGPSFPLKVEKILTKITNAMSKKWTIKLNGKTHQFLATFSRYGLYSMSTSNKPFRPPLFNQHAEFFDEIISARDNSGNDYLFTKMNFCSHVELLGNEYIFDDLYFQIKLNLSSSGSGKILSAGEYITDFNENNPNKRRMKICIDDFKTEQESSNKVPSFISTVTITAICILLSWRVPMGFMG